jgi:hypothetical protein
MAFACWYRLPKRFFLASRQGTFITEWDDGKLENEELLRSEQVAESYADQLVAVARCVRLNASWPLLRPVRHYGFDGWFFNLGRLGSSEYGR